MADLREDVELALVELGWEILTQDDRTDAVMAGHGKYHLMVSFEGEGPSSVIVSYVGRGGGILSMKWAGIERLPTPRKVVRVLSSSS